MGKKYGSLLTLSLATCIIGLMPVNATTITFDSGGTNSGSSYGNVRTFTASGLTVTVTAWSTTGPSAATTADDTSFNTAHSGQYSGYGLGICNQQEGSLDCSDPNHQIDNASQYDFMLFQFSSGGNPLSVNFVSVLLNPYCNQADGCPVGGWDRDVTYYAGNHAAGLNLTGAADSSGLPAMGFGPAQNIFNSPGLTGITVGLSGSGNALLLGALDSRDGSPDRFKIGALSVTASPEPGTFGLLGIALIGLGLAFRSGRLRAN